MNEQVDPKLIIDAINKAYNEASKETKRELSTINMIIAGRTGVGKSTLINSIFGGQMATTGQGESVTSCTKKITKPGIPLAIWDTRGLEMADFRNTLSELMETVKKRAESDKPECHIHIAWHCIAEDWRRVEEGDQLLCQELAKHVQVLGVITKARSDGGFRAEVQRLLPETKNVLRVMAEPEKLDDGHCIPQCGLKDLVDATFELVPESFQFAFAAAQKVSLDKKMAQARKAVNIATALAGGAGVTPLPGADIAALLGIQFRMLMRISAAFGRGPDEGMAAKLLMAAGSSGGAALGGKLLISRLAKFVPGLGTFVGGMISATLAVSSTKALGESYILALRNAYAKAEGKTPSDEDVEREFEKQNCADTSE